MDICFTGECSTCSASSSVVRLSSCSRCKQVYYCGAECQSNDWQTHKKLCKQMAVQRTDVTPKFLSQITELMDSFPGLFYGSSNCANKILSDMIKKKNSLDHGTIFMFSICADGLEELVRSLALPTRKVTMKLRDYAKQVVDNPINIDDLSKFPIDQAALIKEQYTMVELLDRNNILVVLQVILDQKSNQDLTCYRSVVETTIMQFGADDDSSE